LQQRDAWAAVVVVLVERGSLGAVGLDLHHVAGGPTWRDAGLTEELEVAGESRADAMDVGIALYPVVPERDLLGDPAGDGERNLAIAFAGSRRLELGNALLEIRTTIAPEIG